MRIIWHNTWSYPFITSTNHINNTIIHIINVVKKVNPDVIILGELFDLQLRNIYKYILLDSLPQYKFIDIGNDRSWFGQQSGGLFAIYRTNGIKLVDARYHILSNGRLQDRLAAKGVLGMQFLNDNNEYLWICACHLQDADAGFKNFCINNTRLQYTETLNIVKNWCNCENFILTGDFNISPVESLDLWLNTYRPITLLNAGPTHIQSNKILDYALTSLNTSDCNINIVKTNNNPSDHETICITYDSYNITPPPEVLTIIKVKDNLLIYIFIILWLVTMGNYCIV